MTKCEDCLKNVNNICIDLVTKADECSNFQDNTTQKIIEKADCIMQNGDTLRYILDVHRTLHVGDDEIAKTLLVSIAIQSVQNSEGIQPKVSGGSGKGKTHCCKAMAHLLPQQYVRTTSLSDKSIYYLNLIPGCVVFCDDVLLSEQMEATIKRSTSSFQNGDTYTTLDAARNVRIMNIPPRLSWWLTSVDDDQSVQLLNRQFGGNVDETCTQDENVFNFQVEQAISGLEAFPETQDIEVTRQIFTCIKQKLFRVKIPFADSIVWNNKDNRRNFVVFLDIVKAFAVLRFQQRKVDAEGFLYAAIDDFYEAAALYSGTNPNIQKENAFKKVLKLTNAEYELCKIIAQMTKDKDFSDINNIAAKAKLSYRRTAQLLNGRQDRPETGLLHKVRTLRYEKQSLKINENYSYHYVYTLDNFDDFLKYSYVVSIKPADSDCTMDCTNRTNKQRPNCTKRCFECTTNCTKSPISGDRFEPFEPNKLDTEIDDNKKKSGE